MTRHSWVPRSLNPLDLWRHSGRRPLFPVYNIRRAQSPHGGSGRFQDGESKGAATGVPYQGLERETSEEKDDALPVPPRTTTPKRAEGRGDVRFRARAEAGSVGRLCGHRDSAPSLTLLLAHVTQPFRALSRVTRSTVGKAAPVARVSHRESRRRAGGPAGRHWRHGQAIVEQDKGRPAEAVGGGTGEGGGAVEGEGALRVAPAVGPVQGLDLPGVEGEAGAGLSALVE